MNETTNIMQYYQINKSLPPDFLQQQKVQQNQVPIKQQTSQSSKIRMVQDSHLVLGITGQKIAYIGNPHENVKEKYEWLGLNATAYLRHNCSVHMPQLQSNRRRNATLT